MDETSASSLPLLFTWDFNQQTPGVTQNDHHENNKSCGDICFNLITTSAMLQLTGKIDQREVDDDRSHHQPKGLAQAFEATFGLELPNRRPGAELSPYPQECSDQKGGGAIGRDKTEYGQYKYPRVDVKCRCSKRFPMILRVIG